MEAFLVNELAHQSTEERYARPFCFVFTMLCWLTPISFCVSRSGAGTGGSETSDAGEKEKEITEERGGDEPKDVQGEGEGEGEGKGKGSGEVRATHKVSISPIHLAALKGNAEELRQAIDEAIRMNGPINEFVCQGVNDQAAYNETIARLEAMMGGS